MTINIARAWKLTLAWALLLLAVGSVASVLSSAQGQRPSQLPILEGTTILSGDNVGFRVERTQDGVPTGRLVVRVDGRWVEAETLK